MEENSEAQMESDVSSSADATDMQEVKRPLGKLETVIVVETVKDEDSLPESEKKQAVSTAVDNSPVKKSITNIEKSIPIPGLIKLLHKPTQLSLNTSPSNELLLQKDTLEVRTYSRSPLSLLKVSENSPTNPDLSLNQPAHDILDSTSEIIEKKDVKTTIKEQHRGLQKSPDKLQQVNHTQPIIDTVDCPSKKISKKLIISPLKNHDRGIRKSPVKPNQSNHKPILHLANCSTKITPKKGLKASVKGLNKVTLKSLLESEPSDITPQIEKEDSMVKKNKKAPEKQEKEHLKSEDSKISDSEIEPVKIDSNNPTLKMLQNPLLVTALFGKSETLEKDKVQKPLASGPVNVRNSSVEVLSEKSSDSTLETNSDSTEAHSKSISRELKSLIKSAKESKIISECNQLTTKTRKSRGMLDISSSNSTNVEQDRPMGSRRSSDNSLMSNCSEKSDKANLKRSMRSQNPEFVNKVKLFLNSVTGKVTRSDEVMSEEEIEDRRVRDCLNELVAKSPKKKKISDVESTMPVKGNKMHSDPYCWRCHWAVEQEANDKQHPPMLCTVCPRSYHYKCLSGTERSKIISEQNWVCPECLVVLHAESSETRSHAMKKMSLGCLSELLKHALERMMDLNGVEPFMQSVDRIAFPDYDDYIIHPMDLVIMKNNINEGLYGSTEAFLADAQWILHNSIIYNAVQSKLTAAARSLVRSCKVEMGEIEACPECYAAAHSRRPTWFTDVCSTPHMLLWAKLKGFPFWPAKCMSVSSSSLVDVRFFGAHDRAWVPVRDCYLFSEKDPNNFRTKRQHILDSMQEAEQHIRNISRKYGKFVYPPFKTQLDPTKLTEQLKMMIPSFEGEIKAPVKEKSTPKSAKTKSRSNSKGSKSSSYDGEISDNEDTKLRTRKMADGFEIPMDEDSGEQDKTLTLSQLEPSKEITSSRKRRRSELEEAVITIMEGPKQKRKCVEGDPLSQDKQTDLVVDYRSVAESPGNEKDKEKLNEVNMISTLLPANNKDTSSDSSVTENQRPPIKMILKTKKSFKTISAKDKCNTGKPLSFKFKVMRLEKKKSTNKEKLDDKIKSHKRRNSKSKSLNTLGSQIVVVDKSNESNATNVVDNSSENINDKIQEDMLVEGNKLENNVSNCKENCDQKEDNNSKHTETVVNNDISTTAKECEPTTEDKSIKTKDSVTSKEDSSTKTIESEKSNDTNGKINKDGEKSRSNTPKYKETVGNIQTSERNASTKRNSMASPKITKDLIHVDEDNTSLAVIARETSKKGSLTGLPTISSVRSLSSPQTVEGGIKTPTMKVIDTTDSSIFTPTSTDTVRNMKEAITKLNKLRSDNDQSLVGKVGVCAFARMPSTPPTDKTTNNTNEDVQIEIKTEPMEFDDADRQVEKLHLMNSFSLRPVSTTNPSTNLREVRINKIIAGPPNSRKTTTKVAEPKGKAKKTFPQQKKGEDGRSELISKNSMVYIPIQPPVTQAPVRITRPVTVNGITPTITPSRPNLPVITSSATSTVNTSSSTQVILPPPSQASLPATQPSTSVPTTVTVMSVTSQANTPIQPFPTVGSIPTTLHSVHTVPLITSVNGQWTFSLQPIMSVGGLDALDEATTPPLLINGLGNSERNASLPSVLPPASTTSTVTSFGGATKPVMVTVAHTNTPSPKLAVPPLQPLMQGAQVSPLATVNRTATEDTSNTVGEPPRLQHKPLMHPFDTNSPLGNVPTPSTAGPIAAKLNQNAIKLTDFFRTILEDTINRIDEPAAEATSLKLQLEETRWRHQQEVDELKHNHELVLAEMRATFEKERVHAVNEARRVAQVDLEAAVKVAKTKQWCANCSQEAQFYCCWNTSYCDYGCQRAHWTQHYSVCTQQRTQDSNTNTDTESNSVNNRLQSPSENLPKTTAAPMLSKGPVPRVFNKEQQSSPKSIIVSMVEDRCGNTTVKCVGTFKPTAQAQTLPQPQPMISQSIPAPVPLMLNKPLNIMNNEDLAAKKVVTSGGYLIVGSQNSGSLVTPPRRPPTIQYFS